MRKVNGIQEHRMDKSFLPKSFPANDTRSIRKNCLHGQFVTLTESLLELSQSTHNFLEASGCS